MIYAFGIEPFWIETTHHTLSAPIKKTLKIAHLTDIHTRGLGKRENRILKILHEENPDVIVITGDTNCGGSNYKDCKAILSLLKAPLGVYLVRGNWENWFPMSATEELRFYDSLGIKFLLNQNVALREEVTLIGLDELIWGHANFQQAFDGIANDTYKIALFHSPEAFDKISDKLDLALAGHTHGGQINFFGLGPIWLPQGSGDYINGWYTKGDAKMYVSRGIGTSIIPARFFSRPEIAIITLQPEQ